MVRFNSMLDGYRINIMNINDFKTLSENILQECYATIGDKEEYTKDEGVQIIVSMPDIICSHLGISIETLSLLKGPIQSKMERYIPKFIRGPAKIEGTIMAYLCSVMEVTGKAQDGFGFKVLKKSNL